MRPALFIALVLLAACGNAPEASKGGGPLLRIAGSTTLMDRLVPQLTSAHKKSVGDIDFKLEPGGATQGLSALLSGDADVAATARPSSAAEQEQAVANGYSLEAPGARQIVAVNVVAVVVHPTNPIESLTYDQVIGIFCNGSVDNWQFLGEEDATIVPLAPEESSGTRTVFEDFFCGPRGLNPKVQVLPAAQIRERLASDAAAISFASMAEQDGKVLGLRAETESHPVLPSQQNVIRGAYPLYNDIYMYTPGPAKGPAKEFSDWIASPAGQDVVDQQRFVPLFLRPERMDEPRPLRETIHFEPGSREPNQRSVARLQLLVAELKDRSGEFRHVVLEGYCDATEKDPQGLSQARAEGVRDLLNKQLPGTFFEIIPRGAQSPIAPNTTPFGREENRRVQIYLAAEEKPDEPQSNH